MFYLHMTREEAPIELGNDWPKFSQVRAFIPTLDMDSYKNLWQNVDNRPFIDYRKLGHETHWAVRPLSEFHTISDSEEIKVSFSSIETLIYVTGGVPSIKVGELFRMRKLWLNDKLYILE